MTSNHLDIEGTPKYINTLEDAQKQPMRSVNPITVDTLLFIASNTMLLSENFPQSEKSGRTFTKSKKDWNAWKNLYKSSDRKAKVKKGSCRTGPIRRRPWRTKAGVPGRPQVQQANGPTRLADDLDEYNDAAASTT